MKRPSREFRALIGATLDLVWLLMALGFFTWSCLTERPYLAAFWGVLLIVHAINNDARRAAR